LLNSLLERVTRNDIAARNHHNAHTTGGTP